MHYHVLFCIYHWNYRGTFVVPKFLSPLETVDFTGFHCSNDFIVGSFFALAVKVCKMICISLNHYNIFFSKLY